MALVLLGSMLLLLATSLASASCPDREAMTNFDEDRYMGLWHNVREPDRNWPGWEAIKCTHNLLRRGEGSAIESLYMYLNTTDGEYRTISGSMSRAAGSLDGKLEGRFSNQRAPSKYYVLGTDYDHYATLWMCRPKPNGEEGNVEIAVVMSRERTLDQAHLAEANSFLPEGNYRDTNQSECPEHGHGGHAGHGHGGHAHHH